MMELVRWIGCGIILVAVAAATAVTVLDMTPERTKEIFISENGTIISKVQDNYVKETNKPDGLNAKKYRELWQAIENNKKINDIQRTDLHDSLEKKYNREPIYSSGKIDGMGSGYNTYKLILKDGVYETKCEFEKNDKSQKIIYPLRYGQFVTVVGELYFFMYDGKYIYMKNCKIHS